MSQINKKFTISIDWEDFSQLIYRDFFGSFPPTSQSLDRQTYIILDLFAKYDVQATFFVLGISAQSKKKLVKEIAQAGHEIAIHGQNHIYMTKMNFEEAYNDIKHSIDIVTDIIGEKVYGYRAPYFSIVKDNLYVLNILAELGMVYDSSIFPMKLSRYGIKNFDYRNQLYKLSNGLSLVELPPSIFSVFQKNIPVAGGGYFRLFPEFILNAIFSSLSEKDKGAMIYMHPYEFDSKSLNVSEIFDRKDFSIVQKTFLNFRWNLNRKSIYNKIEELLKNFEFVTCLDKALHIANSSLAVEFNTKLKDKF